MTAENRHGSTKPSDEGQRDRPRASERSDQYRVAENVPEGDATVAEREYDDYVIAEDDSDSAEPDVLLDVPVLKVDEINLEVEQLRARVSLQAEVLDLLRLNVGADVFLGRVQLEIKGVEAQALLKVRLENVARILERVLTTIDRNPQILEQITAGARSAVEDVGEGAGSAVEDTGETARRTAQGVGKTVRHAASRGGKTASSAKGAAQKESKRRSAELPDATRGSRNVKRSNGQTSRRTRASDDRSSRT